MTYEPGTYVKGDDERVAKNAKQAVALVFEGFRLRKDSTESSVEAPVAQPVADEPVRDDVPTPRPPKKKD